MSQAEKFKTMFGWLKNAGDGKAKKPLGQLGEELAKEYYRKIGFDIVAANFFNRKGLRLGEVDFIAKTGKEIRFVEVKTRSGSGKYGSGAEAVNYHKQQKLLKAVKVFLQINPHYQALKPQIDVCLVCMEDVDNFRHYVTIIPNAVEDWD